MYVLLVLFSCTQMKNVHTEQNFQQSIFIYNSKHFFTAKYFPFDLPKISNKMYFRSVCVSVFWIWLLQIGVKRGKTLFGWLFVARAVVMFFFLLFLRCFTFRPNILCSNAVHQSFVIVSARKQEYNSSAHTNGAFFVFKCASFIFMVMAHEYIYK